MKKEITMRQRIAARAMLAGKSKKDALLEAGYTLSTALVPQHVTNRKSFQKLLQEEFPDEYILGKHKQLLEAQHTTSIFINQANAAKDKEKIVEMIEGAGGKVIGTRKIMAGLLVFILQPDHDVQVRAYDMLMKLKGAYAAEKFEIDRPYQDMTDEELDAALMEAQKKFKKG